MLKITKQNHPIRLETLVLVCYGLPGVGKSALSFTAEAPLLYDFDKGAYRAKNRKDVVEIDHWSDVSTQTREDLEPYNTLIVDTAGRCLDIMTADIIEQNPKNARGSGDLTLQGFGVLKGRFGSWLKLMKSYGKDIVLVAHMDEKSEGDIVKERIDVQGGSKTEIYKSADAIAKLYIDGKARKLDFSPREGSLGKNPAQLDILTVPDFQKEPEFLAGVIRQIKASINQLSEAQRAEAEAVEAWRTRIGKAQTAQDFNSLLPDAKTSSEVVKALVMAESKERGLKFNKEAGEFYATEPVQAAPAPSTPATPTQTQEPPQKPIPAQEQAPEIVIQEVFVTDVETRTKAGKSYMLLNCKVTADQIEYDLALFCYHKNSMFEHLKEAINKTCVFGIVRHENTKEDKIWWNIEAIERIGDVTFDGGKPLASPAGLFA